ncbi:MAG: hypothetical protein J6I45_03135 [Clostridia bacterium]|nr:hypothetical protein [Clostridia bacterium]
MKFTTIPETTFQQLQLNAGVLLRNFDPASAEVDNADIIGATSGGVTFAAVPSYSDFGDDIDNCPKNMLELKNLDSWAITMGGSFVTVDTAAAKLLIAAADAAENKVTPRNDITDEDFGDIWWVGDYSDKNGETNGGYIAIRMMNALSTGGFSLQTGDRAKGTFAFTFTAHYSMTAQETVPFEVYIKAGTEEA